MILLTFFKLFFSFVIGWYVADYSRKRNLSFADSLLLLLIGIFSLNFLCYLIAKILR